MMAPDELQDTFSEHTDRLQNYAQSEEKMVMLLEARCAMDVGYAGEDSHFWNEFGMGHQDIGAVGRGEHCYRCGGLGHIANDCSNSVRKGKGREDKGYGKGATSG